MDSTHIRDSLRPAGALVFVALLIAVPSRAAAQGSGQPAAPPRVTAGQDGIAIESGDGEYRLQFGLLLHADGRFALDDEAELVTDAFAVRRLRPYLRGRFTRRLEFYINPDLAGSNLAVQDAYADVIFSRAFRVRAGKAKTPFGMERLHPASNLLFMERAFPTALAPNRDVGIQVLGDVAGGVVSYLGGILNGVADGASSDTESNDGKDLAGRLIVRPFARASTSSVRGLGLAFSGSTGEQSGTAAIPAFRTQTLLQPYFSYASGTVADGRRTRYSPQLFLFSGPFGGWAEYVRTTTEISRAAAAVDAAEIDHEAWQIAASWVLTGEAATDAGSGVRPRAPLGIDGGGRGALQVAARYHVLRVESEAFARGLAAAGASRTAEAWTLGLNWYATGNLRYVLNFERTVFDGDADGARPAENALAFRTQVSF